MCNYASNEIKFVAKDRFLLSVLRRRIKRLVDNPLRNSVRNFVADCGYTLNAATRFTDSRDHFSYCDSDISKDGSEFYFGFGTESAWTPNVDALQKVLQERYYGRVELVYVSEESSCGIYEKNDEDERFFRDNYKLDYSYNDEADTVYFRDRDSLIEKIQSIFTDIVIDAEETINSLETKIDNLYSPKDENFYITIKKCLLLAA